MDVFDEIGQVGIALDFLSLEITNEQVTHSFLLLVKRLRVRTKKIGKLLACIMTCRIAVATW